MVNRPMPGVALSRASSELRSRGGTDRAGAAGTAAGFAAGFACSADEIGGESGAGSATTVEANFDVCDFATGAAGGTVRGGAGVDVTSSVGPIRSMGLAGSMTRLD